VGCAGSADREAGVDPTLEAAVLRLTNAWAQADTAALLELFWNDATYEDFVNQEVYVGLEEIVGYITSVHTWGDDVYMNPGRIHLGRDMAVAEWVFSAVQTRPMGSLLAEGSGTEVVLNGVTILEFDEGRIIRAADYADSALLLLQLGAQIEMPGGATYELNSAN
jgi:ketosteroid isomerase-like protein